MNGNGNKAPWEVKKGLRAVESSDGAQMMNPYTTATGMYGQLYNQIKGLPIMQGVSRQEFANDTTLQNQILDMRWRGDIPNVPAMRSNAELYQKDYANQIGDLNFNELAMLSNLTGRQGGREYFASIRKGVPFKLQGINKTPEEYITRIREALKTKKEEATNISNTVPYAAAANDPKAYEFQLDFLEKLFKKDSSLVKEYDNGGVHLPIETLSDYQTGEFSRQDSLDIYNKQEELNSLAEHINLKVQKGNPDRKQIGDLYSDYDTKKFKHYKEYYEKDQDPKDNPFFLKGYKGEGALSYSGGYNQSGTYVPSKREGEYVGNLPALNKYKPVKPSEPKVKKKEKLLKIDPIQTQLLPVDLSMNPIEAGIPIDTDKYKYLKYYKNGYRVRVIDKSKKGKTEKIQTVDDVSLEQFNIRYKYKR